MPSLRTAQSEDSVRRGERSMNIANFRKNKSSAREGAEECQIIGD